MKSLYILLFLFSVPALASFEDKLAEIERAQQAEFESYKSQDPNWNRVPNDPFVKFYSDWLLKGHRQKIDLYDSVKDECEKSGKHCLSVSERNFLYEEMNYKISHARHKNELAKDPKLSDPQKSKALAALVRKDYVKLCKSYGKCEKLTPFDRRYVEKEKVREEKLKLLEKELGSLKDDDPVKDDKISAYLDEKKKLFLADLDELCKEAPAEEETCSADLRSEFEDGIDQEKCLVERRRLVRSKLPQEKHAESFPTSESHGASWSALTPPRKCEELLKHDEKSLGGAPVVEGGKEEEKSPEVKPEAPALAPVSVTEKPKEQVSLEVNDDPKNYDPESCEWVEDMPRKIVAGPGGKGCMKDPKKGVPVQAQICTGYVACKRIKGGGKFIRMSTCSPVNCAKGKAVECTKQPSYHSVQAEGSHETIHSEIRKILEESGTYK